jgi:hypothetical protein
MPSVVGTTVDKLKCLAICLLLDSLYIVPLLNN